MTVAKTDEGLVAVAAPWSLTPEQLLAVMPRCPRDKLTLYCEHLSAAMREADITTPLRAAAFLAQLAVESGDLRYWEELADGSAYEGRKDLGNAQRGDGKRYKGRGPLQLTGRYNYRAAGEALGLPLEDWPSLAASVDVGFRVAAWYWTTRKLNAKADVKDFAGVTRAINGAATLGAPSHHTRRVEVYVRALDVLGSP